MRWALVTLVVAGCYVAPIDTPTRRCSGEGAMRVWAPYARDKVDVLFVVDDSPGMAPKQEQLRARMGDLVAKLDALAAGGNRGWYHFGVVTSDLGAGGQTLPDQRCHPGGDGAALRVTPAASDAPAACGAFSLTGGVRYLDDNQLAGTSNVAGGLDVATALQCMVSVGDGGCAFPQPLEASWRALHDPVPANQGFLRSDALLAVVYVGDRDDCSAPPTTDLFDPAATQYGVLDRFRCTQYGVACNGQPVPAMSVAGLTGCTPLPAADGGKLLDVERYIDFFTQPAARGGVKVDPGDVLLVGIAGPADPVGVTVPSPCPDATAASCPVLDHSCVSPADAARFGDPAVRLDAVVTAAKHHERQSICDADYAAALDTLVANVAGQIAPGCLDFAVATRADGTPDCTAADVTANPDGSTSLTPLPSCAANGDVAPCWRLVDLLPQYRDEGCDAAPAAATCKLPPGCQPVTSALDGTQQLYRAEVDRGGAPAPAATVASLSCSIPCR